MAEIFLFPLPVGDYLVELDQVKQKPYILEVKVSVAPVPKTPATRPFGEVKKGCG